MKGRNLIRVTAALMAVTLALPMTAMAGEWRKNDIYWNYHDDNGQMLKNMWLKDADQKWYFTDEQGNMKTGWHLDANGKWYYLNADGSMASGWIYLNGKWYYLNPQSGELLINTVTPDGYKVDANGAWTGQTTNVTGSTSSSSSKNKTGGENENGGDVENGGENGGNTENGGDDEDNGKIDNENENENGGENGGVNENPWAEQNPLALDLTGIVSVSGITYAVISFDDVTGQELFKYAISGTDVTDKITPVTQSEDVLKVALTDNRATTLKVTSLEGGEVIVSLGELGSSKIVKEELNDSGIVLIAEVPELVLAAKTIPLIQYVKFVRTGSKIYVKPSRTTVNTAEEAAYRSDIDTVDSVDTTHSINTVNNTNTTNSIDAVSSATNTAPTQLEGQEKEAVIAVLFDMVVNHTIAQETGRAGKTTTEFLTKWADLDKTIALNQDYSSYLDGDHIGALNWQPVTQDLLPRYVKYQTEQHDYYGTKVGLLTGRTDNANPPELMIEPSLIGTDAAIQLSEENESWYLSITEIKIPYSSSKTHYYQKNNTLSEDGLTISLGVKGDGVSGPMNYAGEYEVTISAYEFENCSQTLSVVEKPPAPESIEVKWDDDDMRLSLKTAAYSYYPTYVKTVTVNDTVLQPGQFTTGKSGINYIYIPYGYLTPGENTIVVQAAGHADLKLMLTAPDDFVTPQAAPQVTLKEVLTGSKTPIAATAKGDASGEWLDKLELAHIKLLDGNASCANLQLEKTDDGFNLTTTTTLYTYREYTLKIAVPDYDVVSVTIIPVKEAPEMVQTWSADRLLLNETPSGYYSSSVDKIIVNGQELEKGLGADYVSSYSQIEMFSHNFVTGEAYRIELYASGYAMQTITGNAPEGLLILKEAPALNAGSIGKGESVVITAAADDWLGAITGVAVEGGYYNASYHVSADGIRVTTSDFNYTGTYTVYVTADGYRTAQVSVTVLNSTAVASAIDYEADRLELTAGDSSFFRDATVTLNGNILEKDSDYTVSSRYLYIPGRLLAADENRLVFTNPGYKDVIVEVGGYIAWEETPLITRDTVYHSEKVLVLNVDSANSAWYEALTEENISITRGYSNVSISNFEKSEEGIITIELKNAFDAYYDYTVKIAVDGYQAYTETFKPIPDIASEWQSGGNLELTTTLFGYFGKSYTKVYLDGEEFVRGEDFEISGSYKLVIYASSFTSDTHTIRIEYDGYSSYEPVEFEVEVEFPALARVKRQDLETELPAALLPEAVEPELLPDDVDLEEDTDMAEETEKDTNTAQDTEEELESSESEPEISDDSVLETETEVGDEVREQEDHPEAEEDDTAEDNSLSGSEAEEAVIL